MDAEQGLTTLAQLAALFDTSADGVYVVDVDQRIVYWNAAATEMTGEGAEALIGRRCYEVVGGVDFAGRCICKQDCQTIVRVRRGEAVPDYDVLCRAFPGRRLLINISIMPARVAGFEHALAVHIFRDVSGRHICDPLDPSLVAALEQMGPPDDAVAPALTAREGEVLRLLAAGSSVRDIAKELVVTPNTVRNHIENLMGKLGAHGRLQAIAIAARHGLLGKPGAE